MVYMVTKFLVGNTVMRTGGSYEFPGIVIGVGLKQDGKILYIVEATGKGYEGMVHIFRE